MKTRKTQFKPWLILALMGASTMAQSSNLVTQPGMQLGLSVSQYKYSEPGYMNLKASKIGVDVSKTHVMTSAWPHTSESWFMTGEFRLATGSAEYNGASGTASGLRDWYWETRALIGTDFAMNGYVLSPYVGLGYRHLNNDLRSLVGGYRRQSTYLSLPIGLTHKFKDSPQSQIATTLEYIHLIRGRQTAQLSDYTSLRSDVTMRQKRGYGVRFKILKQLDTWSIGPSLTYWKLDASETSGTSGFFEPKNNTVELGLNLSFRF